ncbi:type IX secretion system motor protein PorL/GldL [Emticicia sp. 17c]|uniref:type IX secretion system motor protein PorL/GldL n=1 Tax=Emticicia sp. 17c TaxID=3127704 RepID=UPI00301D3939
MAAKNNTNFFWDKLVPTIYALGAAVVILGAMGKIMHYEALAFMLPIGLGTEAFIFILYAIQSFLFPPVEYQWEKAYPELADDYQGELPTRRNVVSTQGAGLTAKMDDMLANARISPDIFDNLKSGIQSLTGQVAKMSDLSDAAAATSEYAKNVKAASTQVTAMNNAYGTAVNAMTSMADATKDAQEYRAQFTKITQTMGALNAVYELELQDTDKHLKAMNAFYSNLTNAMQDMAEASKETQQFKSEMTKLTNNLSSLNNVYGSMLSAMRGN